MNEERPTVLLTGASGLLGWSIKRQFAPRCRILAPDLDEFDLRKPEAAVAWIKRANPHLVIHAAAYTAVDKAEEEPAVALALNGRGTEAVAEGAREAAACLVYISTDYLFDGTKGTPYTERDELHPLGSYAISKLAGEEAVRRILDHYLIVRTAWIFGPGRPNFVQNMARRAFAGERVRVVNDQTGSPTYTPHLAAALDLLCQQRITGTLNVVNSGSATWFDLTRETYRLAGADPGLVEPMTTADLNRPAPRPSYSVLDASRFSRLAGAPLPPWREALAEYFRERELWDKAEP